MIQANDLRIGNSVQSDAGYVGKVVNFTENTIRLKMEHSRLKIVTFKGIEGLQVDGILLTPEILVKCGFEPWMDVDENEMMRREEFSIEWMEFLSIDSGYHFNWQSPEETKVTYLHELQNLYFALTKEELEFKP